MNNPKPNQSSPRRTDWAKVFQVSLIAAIVLTAVAMLARWRTFIILGEVLDLIFLVLFVIALILAFFMKDRH